MMRNSSKSLIPSDNEKSIYLPDDLVSRGIELLDNLSQGVIQVTDRILSREFYGGRVNKIIISNRQNLLASSGIDNYVIIWDLDSGEPVQRLGGHDHNVMDISFYSNDEYLVSLDWKSINIWSISTGELVTKIKASDRNIDPEKFVIIEKEQKLLFSCLAGGLRYIDIQTKEEEFVYYDDSYNVAMGMAVSPDERYILISDMNDKIYLFDWKRKKISNSLLDDYRWTYAIDYADSGKFIVVGSSSKIDLVGLFGEENRRFYGHTGKIHSIDISGDSKYFVSGGQDKTVRLWDVEQGSSLKTFSGHKDFVTSVVMQQIKSKTYSSSADGQIFCWDNPTGDLVRTFNGHKVSFKTIKFSPNGEILAVGEENGRIRLLRTDSLREIGELYRHTSLISDLEFSPDGSVLYSTSWDSTYRSWDITEQGELFVSIPHDSERSSSLFVDNLAVSTDGKYLITVSHSIFRVWDLEENRLIDKFEIGRHTSTYGCYFLQNSYYIICAGNYGLAKLDISAAHKSPVFINTARNVFRSLSISIDGKYAFAGAQDGSLALWNTQKNAVVRNFSGHDGTVLSVGISDNDFIGVSGGLDTNIKLWNLESGEEIETFHIHEKAVTSIDVHKNTFASCGSDGKVNIVKMPII